MTCQQDGIERLLRLFQSLTQLLLSYPPLLSLSLSLLSLLPSSPNSLSLLSSDAAATEAALLPKLATLRNRLATLRRPLRLFRFLDAFASAWSAWSSSALAVKNNNNNNTPAADTRALLALDAAARSFNAMYLLLESATFVEALDVPGLSVWGEQTAKALAVEAQRFWFFALVCGVVVGAGRLVVGAFLSPSGARAEGRPVEGVREEEEGEEGGAKGSREKGVAEAEAAAADWRRAGVGRGGWKGKKKIVRRLLADVMDLAVPGSVVGWVPLAPGTVSALMFGSTVLTGLEVWERCGRELAAAKKGAAAGGKG